MCRNTLSVDWQGNLYDCDFNQMFDLPAMAEPAKDTFVILICFDVIGR